MEIVLGLVAVVFGVILAKRKRGRNLGRTLSKTGGGDWSTRPHTPLNGGRL